MRVGTGFDVHLFAEGRPLVLGGVEIPFEKGLSGHSDADVLIHAVCDALLGALALGDIGVHFPQDDPKYKDASSIDFLKAVGVMIGEKGYGINNIDSTVIAEEPKISPHSDRMRKAISEALKIDVGKVSVKATTTEGAGFTGRREGIAAQAVAALSKLS